MNTATDQKKMTEEEISKMISLILCDKLNLEEHEVTSDANLIDDLGADSLDIVEIAMDIEKEVNFAIEDEELSQIHTVGDAINLIMKKQNEN